MIKLNRQVVSLESVLEKLEDQVTKLQEKTRNNRRKSSRV